MQVILSFLLALNVFALSQASPSSASPADHTNSPLSNTEHDKRSKPIGPTPYPQLLGYGDERCSGKAFHFQWDTGDSCRQYHLERRYFQFNWTDITAEKGSVQFYNNLFCEGSLFYTAQYNQDTCFDVQATGPLIKGMLWNSTMASQSSISSTTGPRKPLKIALGVGMLTALTLVYSG